MNIKNYAALTLLGLSTLVGKAQDDAPSLPLSEFVAQQQFYVPDSLDAHLYSVKDLDDVFMKKGDKDKSGNVAYLTKKLVDNSLGQNVKKYSPVAAEIEIPNALYKKQDNVAEDLTLEEVMNLPQDSKSEQNFFDFAKKYNLSNEAVNYAFYYSVLGKLDVPITEDARGERMYNISRLLAEDLLENGTEVEKTVIDSSLKNMPEKLYMSSEDLALNASELNNDSIPPNIFMTDAASFYHQEDGKELDKYGQAFFREYLVNNTPKQGDGGNVTGLGVIVYTSKKTDKIKEVEFYPLVNYAAVGKIPFGKVMNRMTDDHKTNLLRNSLEQAVEGTFVDKRDNIDCADGYVIELLPQKQKDGQPLNQGIYLGAGAYADNGAITPELAVGILTNSVGAELRARYNPQTSESQSFETISTEQVGQTEYTLEKLTEKSKQRIADLGLALPIKITNRLYAGPYIMGSIDDELTQETRFGTTQLNPPNGPTQRVIEDATSENEIMYSVQDIGVQALYGLNKNLSLSLSGGYNVQNESPVVGGRLNYHFNGGNK